MPSTSTLVDSIYTRRVSAGECYPSDLVKSHKEDPLGIQLIIPGIVGIATIHDHDAAFGWLQRPGSGNVMGFAIGDGQKGGQHAVMVEASSE